VSVAGATSPAEQKQQPVRAA